MTACNALLSRLVSLISSTVLSLEGQTRKSSSRPRVETTQQGRGSSDRKLRDSHAPNARQSRVKSRLKELSASCNLSLERQAVSEAGCCEPFSCLDLLFLLPMCPLTTVHRASSSPSQNNCFHPNPSPILTHIHRPNRSPQYTNSHTHAQLVHSCTRPFHRGRLLHRLETTYYLTGTCATSWRPDLESPLRYLLQALRH